MCLLMVWYFVCVSTLQEAKLHPAVLRPQSTFPSSSIFLNI